MLQLNVVISEDGIQFFTQFFRMQQINDTDGAACHFVFVGWADAATGRADFAFAARCFAGLVKRDVVRQDQRTGRRDFQTTLDVFHACCVQLVDFAQQCFGGYDNAGTDEAIQVFMQDAARNQAQNGFLAADDQSMTRIVAALETHDTAGFFRQPVDYFTFAFIAPLGADYYNIFSHSHITY